jgi:hypothetical protein
VERQRATSDTKSHDRRADEVSRGGLAFEDLQIGQCVDPSKDTSLRLQILSKLGLRQDSRIEALVNDGQLNEGIWHIQGTDSSNRSKSFVLKVVKQDNSYGCSESQKLLRFSQMYPSIRCDNSVAFPTKIFNCIDHAGTLAYQCIVMPKVVGKELGEFICQKWQREEKELVMQILYNLGVFLADFHKRYDNHQHGDFHESNVFYDESSCIFTLIDLAELGSSTSDLEGDMEQFMQRLSSLSNEYGEEFSTSAKKQFEEGYMARKHSH